MADENFSTDSNEMNVLYIDEDLYSLLRLSMEHSLEKVVELEAHVCERFKELEQRILNETRNKSETLQKNRNKTNINLSEDQQLRIYEMYLTIENVLQLILLRLKTFLNQIVNINYSKTTPNSSTIPSFTTASIISFPTSSSVICNPSFATHNSSVLNFSEPSISRSTFTNWSPVDDSPSVSSSITSSTLPSNKCHSHMPPTALSSISLLESLVETLKGRAISLVSDSSATPFLSNILSTSPIPSTTLPSYSSPISLPKSTVTLEILTGLQSLLWVALEEEKFEFTKWLLDIGVDANLRDADRNTPLHLAAQRSLPEMVALLLENGADVHVKNNSSGSTPLHCAVSDRSGECVSLLIAAAADVNCQSVNGSTPLHWAACCNNEAAVRLLISAGANKSAKYNTGRTPQDCTKDDVLRKLLKP